MKTGKLKHFFWSIWLFLLPGLIFAQADSLRSTKLVVETDISLFAFTGGTSTNLGLGYKCYRMTLGYAHFNAPSEFFSGKPEGFDLMIDHIFSVNVDYFLNGKADKGFYTRLMYHNKQQTVTNIENQVKKTLHSQLAGLELGYVWKFYKGFYIAPRIGALYYFQRPQGKDNNPVLIGDKYYDNKRHKTWDTYYIPSFFLGYSLTL